MRYNRGSVQESISIAVRLAKRRNAPVYLVPTCYGYATDTRPMPMARQYKVYPSGHVIVGGGPTVEEA